MGRLRESVEDAARASAHGAVAARELFEHRDDYRHALDTLRRLEVEDRLDLFEAEIARVYFRDPQRLTRSGFRSDLVVEWIEILLEAVEHVRETLDRADHFRDVAAGMSGEDREYREAMRRKNADRLREAS